MKNKILQAVAASLFAGLMAFPAFAQEEAPKSTTTITVIVKDKEGKQQTWERTFEGKMSEEMRTEMDQFTKDKEVVNINVNKTGGEEQMDDDEYFFGEKEGNQLKIVRFHKKQEGDSPVELHEIVEKHKADLENIDGKNAFFINESGEVTQLEIEEETFEFKTKSGKVVRLKSPQEEDEMEVEIEKHILVEVDGDHVIVTDENGDELEGEQVIELTDDIKEENGVTVRTVQIKIIRKVTIEDVKEADRLPEELTNTRETEFGKQMQDISFYPNPNEGRFTVSFDLKKEGDTNISIYDLQGRKVYEEILRDFSGLYKKEIDLTNRDKGMYILKITQGKKALTKKIILE